MKFDEMEALPAFVRELLGRIQDVDLKTSTMFILGTVAFLSAAYTIQTFLVWYRLRHIPGPFLNSITPLVLTYHCIKEDITEYTHSLSVKYGPLVRVSPTVVMYSDPDTFRRICSVKAGYTKGLWFEFSRWDLKRYSIIAMRDNESRKERKSKLSPAVRLFSSAMLFATLFGLLGSCRRR